MLYHQLNRQSRHKHNTKKCRSIFGSIGTFLFDKFFIKSIFSIKIYYFLPRTTAFKIFA